MKANRAACGQDGSRRSDAIAANRTVVNVSEGSSGSIAAERTDVQNQQLVRSSLEHGIPYARRG